VIAITSAREMASRSAGLLESWRRKELSMTVRTLEAFVKIALVSTCSVACAAESAETSETSVPQAVTSEHALYAGSLLLQPTIGDNVAVFDLTQPTGERVAHASMAAWLRMPEHGHFSSQTPICVESGDGRYQIVNLVFDSAGSWRLDLTVRAESGLDVFEVPLNVEH
jgi:hypothetical protein